MEVETIEERQKCLKREYQRQYRQRQKEICGVSNNTLIKRQKRKVDKIGETKEDTVARRARSAIGKKIVDSILKLNLIF